MTEIELAYGFLAGVASCLTPEALLLFPVALAAAGAAARTGVIPPAVGFGLSFALTGMTAGSLAGTFGVEAIWFRRAGCALLFLQGTGLMSVSLVERLSLLTGGETDGFTARGPSFLGGASRQFLLAALIGAIWYPLLGPTLGEASLMAADRRNTGLAQMIFFAFGMGAAVPWILLGRFLRPVLRPLAEGVLLGMAGKRVLGVALIAVAGLAASGLDFAMEHWLDARLPAWAHDLALRF